VLRQVRVKVVLFHVNWFYVARKAFRLVLAVFEQGRPQDNLLALSNLVDRDARPTLAQLLALRQQRRMHRNLESNLEDLVFAAAPHIRRRRVPAKFPHKVLDYVCSDRAI